MSLLYQLPNEFKKDNGGGYSFPYACIDIDGCQWGEHVDAERLIALGTAIGLVQCPIPREMWKILPMGLPYYIILSERNITQNVDNNTISNNCNRNAFTSNN